MQMLSIHICIHGSKMLPLFQSLLSFTTPYQTPRQFQADVLGSALGVHNHFPGKIPRHRGIPATETRDSEQNTECQVITYYLSKINQFLSIECVFRGADTGFGKGGGGVRVTVKY